MGGGASTTPFPVAGLAGAVAVAGGEKFSLALKGGNVMAWGDNCFGELGNGTSTCNSSPTPAEVCETGSGTCPSGPYLSNVKEIQAGATSTPPCSTTARSRRGGTTRRASSATAPAAALKPASARIRVAPDR